ncbi:unnamed protein product [Protopolystoma xenopodis]|uniref:Uncharacterized protein n=1 Tax=Protopolystoma xenopodis TaxID=117903 RepID=A0A448XH00_9PLAT|nr:unnamed protein product [Protopolystoma xenopodis]
MWKGQARPVPTAGASVDAADVWKRTETMFFVVKSSFSPTERDAETGFQLAAHSARQKVQMRSLHCENELFPYQNHNTHPVGGIAATTLSHPTLLCSIRSG